MNASDMMAKAAFTGVPDLISNILAKKHVVWYGIVKDVPAEGIVTVASAAAPGGEQVVLTDCVLLCPASASLAVSVVPHEGDKVLVLSPQSYADEMFLKESENPIVEPLMTGYTATASVAILYNQFQSFHKNSVTVEDGTLEARLAYSEEDSDDDKDVNNLHVKTEADGSFLAETAYLPDDEVYGNVLSALADGSFTLSRKYRSDDEVYDHVTEQVVTDDGIKRTASDGYVADKEVYATVITSEQDSAGTDIKIENGYVADNEAYEQLLEMKKDGSLAYSCGYDKDNSVYKASVEVKPDGSLAANLAEKDGDWQGKLAVAAEDGTLTYATPKLAVTCMGDGGLSFENENVSFSATNDGEVSLTVGGTSISVKDGEVSVDDGANKITTGSSGIELTDGSGKVSMSSGAITLQGTSGKVEIS